MDRPTFIGVDFSVRKRDAGEGMWVARAHERDDGGLVVTAVETAADAFDCGTDRESTFEALVQAVADAADADGQTTFGFDVPFGIGTVEGSRSSWVDWVKGFPASVVEGAAVDDPEALYRAYKEAGFEPDADSMRATDAARGGLPPLNWRMKDLTYRAVEGVLRPIIRSDAATVAPFMEERPGVPVVVETYPAAVFDTTDGASRDGYKGVRRSAYDQRRDNVEALTDAGVTFDDPDAKRRISCHDDALDAVAACVGAFRAARDGFEPGPDAADPETVAVEGYIYA
ncbi:hypothetical protein JCM17823_11740 [Halorubrum gandharaense]